MSRLLRWLLGVDPPIPFWCPWCGHRARINTESPLTINCDRCEVTTQVAAVS